MLIKEEIEDYARYSTSPEPELLQELQKKTYEQMESPQMLTGRLEGRFLKLLVQISQPKLVLEVGTFTGYSALSMAEGLPEDSRIITCEIDPKAKQMAQAAFDESPHGHKIEIRFGPALDTISQLTDTIDFAFIDADKENYVSYYEAVIKKLRPGGLILADNMLWSGEVLEPKDEAGRAVAKLNQIITQDNRVENVLLTIRDGVQLVRKL